MTIDDVSIKNDVDESLERASEHRPWDRYLDMALGLRNYWYPAFFSHELAEGEVRMEEICGERIMFKRIDGKVYGVQDRCLHRGVAFSSRPECHSKNSLTCWFHGFTYDMRDGGLMAVLSQPDSALIRQVGLPTYETREAFRTVFVYIGDGEPRPFDEDLPRKLQLALNGEARRVFHPLVRVRIPCDWRLALENGFDPGHVYGHRFATVRKFQNAPLVRYPDRNSLRFEESPGVAKSMFTNNRTWTSVWSAEIEGVVVDAGGDPEAPDRRAGDSAPDVIEQGGGAAHLPCMYEASGFPDGKQTHFEWFVPIDEEHHMYTILQSVVVRSDEEEATFHREADEKWGPLVWSMVPEIEGFNNFDAFGRTEVMHGYNSEDFWHKEYFYKPDFILTQWRMFVSKHAREIQRRTDMQRRPPREPSTVVYHNQPGTIRPDNK
jgi:carbazole 1,9a-dioxygenase